MAHFNPDVTVGFLITKHITKVQLRETEITGALLGSLFVKYLVGNYAKLGANASNYCFPVPIFFGLEVFASAPSMADILAVAYI